MFECPGCKHIVDDSIKKCPNCAYDIKKYTKARKNEAKRTGKNFGEETIALSSVYSANTKAPKVLPQLDFLSKTAGVDNSKLKEIPNQPIFDSPSLNAASRNTSNASATTNRTFGEPSTTKIIEEPVFESPSLNKKDSYLATPVSNNDELPFGGATDIGFTAPGLGVTVAPPSTGRPPVNGESYGSISIPAPNIAAPERQPIVPTEPVVPPTPVYNDTPSVAQPVFDSPSLNSGNALLSQTAKPAAILSENSDIRAQGYGMNTGARNVSSTFVPTGEVVDGIFDSPILNEQAKAIAEGRYVPTSVASQASLADLNKPKIPGAISHTSFGQSVQSSYKDPAHQGAMYGKEVQKPNLTNFNGNPVNNGYQSAASAEVYLANPLLATSVAPSSLPPNPIAQNMGNVSADVNNNPEISGVQNDPQSQGTVFSPTYSSFGNTPTAAGAPNPLLAGNASLNAGNPLLGNRG